MSQGWQLSESVLSVGVACVGGGRGGKEGGGVLDLELAAQILLHILEVGELFAALIDLV
jgi:hypothetical protein